MNTKQPYAWVWESEEKKQMGKAWKEIHPVTQRPSMRYTWEAITPLFKEEPIDFAKDAKEWGNALNDAGWTFNETYTMIIGEPPSAHLFNSTKTLLRECIIEYAKKIDK